MLGEPYTLKYTEQFRDDLSDAVRYIVQELRNPDAAQSLKDKVMEVRRFIYARRDMNRQLP